MINIPVYGIHHDPDYYPEAEKYRPERFTPDEVVKRPMCSFLPFGEGPRICIGLRFGLMQAKLGLALLLKNFRFTLHPSTPVPLEIHPNMAILTSMSDILLKMEKIA